MPVALGRMTGGFPEVPNMMTVTVPQVGRRPLRAAAFLAAVVAGLGASAQDARDALSGRDVRLIIAAGAGGGSDQMGRMLAAAMDRALPQSAIHVQNLGGAGGGLAMAEVQSATGQLATLGFSNNGPVYIQLSGTAAAQFDLAALQWIGSVGDNQRLMVMRKGLGPPTLETLRNLDRQPILAVAGSAGSASFVEAMLFNPMLSLRMRVAADLDDPVVQSLMLAGDVDLTLGSYASLKPLLDADEADPVFIYARNGAPEELVDVPALADLVPPGEFDTLVDMIASLSRSGRIVVASPAIASDAVAALRAAFDIAVADPVYEAEMAAGAYVVNASAGSEIEQRIETYLDVDGDFIALFRRFLACGERISDGAAASCE